MQDLEEYQKQIIIQFDHISKKYDGTYCDRRSLDCLNQNLYNIYKCEVKPILGEELGKKVFKESLIKYCGFAYGVTLFEDLFSNN